MMESSLESRARDPLKIAGRTRERDCHTVLKAMYNFKNYNEICLYSERERKKYYFENTNNMK